MKKCNKCGTRYKDDWTFCPKDGTPLKANITAENIVDEFIEFKQAITKDMQEMREIMLGVKPYAPRKQKEEKAPKTKATKKRRTRQMYKERITAAAIEYNKNPNIQIRRILKKHLKRNISNYDKEKMLKFAKKLEKGKKPFKAGERRINTEYLSTYGNILKQFKGSNLSRKERSKQAHQMAHEQYMLKRKPALPTTFVEKRLKIAKSQSSALVFPEILPTATENNFVKTMLANIIKTGDKVTEKDLPALGIDSSKYSDMIVKVLMKTDIISAYFCVENKWQYTPQEGLYYKKQAE